MCVYMFILTSGAGPVMKCLDKNRLKFYIYTSYHYQIKTESLLLYVEVLSAGLLTSGKFERLLDFVHVNSCESPMSLPLVQDGFEWLNKSHYLLKTCTIDELH